MADWGAIIGAIGQGAGAAGQIAASRAAAKAGGRQQQFEANQVQDNFDQRNYATEQNATLTAASMAEAARLARAKLGLDAPEQRTKQALWGDLINNIRDVNVSVPGHIQKSSVTGGLRPSLIGAGGRQAGSALQTQALQALLSGSDVPEMPDYSKTLLTPPEATPQPQAGAEDKWLNIMATLGQIAQGADTVNRMRPNPRTGTSPGGVYAGGTYVGE